MICILILKIIERFLWQQEKQKQQQHQQQNDNHRKTLIFRFFSIKKRQV